MLVPSRLHDDHLCVILSRPVPGRSPARTRLTHVFTTMLTAVPTWKTGLETTVCNLARVLMDTAYDERMRSSGRTGRAVGTPPSYRRSCRRAHCRRPGAPWMDHGAWAARCRLPGRGTPRRRRVAATRPCSGNRPGRCRPALKQQATRFTGMRRGAHRPAHLGQWRRPGPAGAIRAGPGAGGRQCRASGRWR